MSSSSQLAELKHWFKIDRKEEGRLVAWLKNCTHPVFCEGTEISKPSTDHQHQCGYTIADGNTPETKHLIYLSLYTDLRTLDASFLGALRGHFSPVESSEQQ